MLKLTYLLVAAVKKCQINCVNSKEGGVYIPITVLFSFPFPSLLEADTDTEMLLFMSRERKQACGSDDFKLEVVTVVQEGLARLSLNSTVKLRTSPLMPFDMLNRSCNACTYTMVKLLPCAHAQG